MILTRRRALRLGGGLVAALALSTRGQAAEKASGEVEIQMHGRDDGAVVWFDPLGLWIAPGQSVRWRNVDPGNSHTSTAYDPANFDHPRRIPAGAAPWNSDYLLPGESFAVTLSVPGVYDYFCVPHELSGMVGRIVVGTPAAGWVIPPKSDDSGAVPEEALTVFPSVEEIVRLKRVHGPR